MDEDEVTTEVEVSVETPQDDAPEVAVDAAPVVIVEDSGSDAGTVTEAEAERRVEEAREQTALEIAVAGLIETVGQLQAEVGALAAVQGETAEVVSEVIETQQDMGDALTEEVAESTGADLDGDGRPDDPPQTARKHWLFRSLSEWRS